MNNIIIETNREVVRESLKKICMANSELKNSLEFLLDKKVGYICEKAYERTYLIDGLIYTPIYVKRSAGDYSSNSYIEVGLACKPDSIQNKYTLTRREKEIISEYRSIYERFHGLSFSLKLNEKLASVFNDRHQWDIRYMKHKLRPILCSTFAYSLDDILSPDFIIRRMIIDGETYLW